MPFISHKEWPIKEHCISPEHNPPGHIVLRPGIHIWKCPRCGKTQRVVVPEAPRLNRYMGGSDEWRIGK